MKTPSPELQVTAGLDHWAPQWDHLVDSATLPSPFLRSWWLEGTAGPRGRFLLVVEEVGRLVGGLALEEGRMLGLPVFRLMGSRGRLCPDHLDLVAAPGEDETVVRALRTWFGRPGSRWFDLDGVRSGSRLAAVLPTPSHCRPQAVAPWAEVPDGSVEALSGLPSRFRRQVRRASERLASDGATYRANRGAAAVRSLETLRRLHQEQWGSRSEFLPEFDRFAAACRLGAGADEVVVHELATEAAVVAMVVAFEVAGRVSLYQSARRVDERWREATAVLLTTIISDAHRRGFSEVDFLRGDEPYKARYASGRRQLVRLLAGTGLGGRLLSGSAAAASLARLEATRSLGAARRARRPGA